MRLYNGWQYFGTALIFVHFVFPFALLLSRNNKRSARRIVAIALLLMFMRLVDLFWLTAPNFYPGTSVGLNNFGLPDAGHVRGLPYRHGRHLAVLFLPAAQQARAVAGELSRFCRNAGSESMDKDKFTTQSGGHLKEGHEESDLSIRGIVLFGVFLAVGGILAFVLMFAMIHGLEKWEKSHDAKLTPVEQQMQKERDTPREGLGKVIPTSEGEIKPAPDSYGRVKMEDHLSRTFRAPRLQFDDEDEMKMFRGSEEEWLSSTGKDASGSIHIPVSRAMEVLAQRGFPQVSGPFQPANVGAKSAAYPNGAADSGQPVRSNAGGPKK